MIFMGIYNKVYIGHVETINPDVIENVSPVESKVVALKLASIDKVTSIPTYKPLRPYSEYYKLVSVDSKPLEGPLGNIVDDKIINIALKKTGKTIKKGKLNKIHIKMNLFKYEKNIAKQMFYHYNRNVFS